MGIEVLLKQNGMDIFDKYFWATNNKDEVCKQENVDIMIDDSNKKCEMLAPGVYTWGGNTNQSTNCVAALMDIDGDGKNNKFNKTSLLNVINDMNNSFEENIRNKNHDIFLNYKLNNNNHFTKYFINNISSNKFNKKKSIKPKTKKVKEYITNHPCSSFYIKKNKIKKDNNIENLIRKIFQY